MNASINSSNTALIPKGEIAGTAIRALCFLLGMCGNITVIVVLVRNFKKKDFTLQLMLNLAASDILCMAMLPVWMFNLLLGWTVDLHLCPFFVFVTHIAIHASVFIVTLMSVQRYVMVLYRPQWSRLGGRGECVVLVFVWVLAGALAFSPAATYGVVQDGTRQKCEQVFRSEEQKVGVLLLETVCFFVVPFSTLMVSYLCLHKKVSEKSMGSHQRLAILVTMIVVTFFIFCIPYHIVNVMTMAAPLEEPVQLVRRVAYRGPRRVTQGIAYLNSCVNPLLYAFNYRSLRAENSGTDINTPQTSNDFS
ncbi:leukotriene B4 receptor 1-like [Alosa pseudoharengus]|uniref:leukotriene B4 receptor 1-like n=1 Tax=Alosa pseudoharengus TaxID=34774 RepID=UPI003F8B70A3